MNTGFVPTTTGLLAAQNAHPYGPVIHITKFRVGSAFNYTPLPSDVDLNGTQLYEGIPTSVTQVGVDLLQIMLVMDVTVGSFKFGECALILADGTTLAKCVWDTLQDKVRAVGNQAGNFWRIRVLLKLAEAPSVVQIDIFNGQSILEVPAWEMLEKPGDQLNGANIAIVHANNDSDEPVLVIRDYDEEWGLVGYNRMHLGNVADSGTSVTMTSLSSPALASLLFEGMPKNSSEYLIKFSNGQIRKIVDSPYYGEIVWSPAVATPVGEYSIWEAKRSQAVYWADTVEYNYLANLINPYWSTPSGWYDATNKGMNQYAVPLLSRRTTPADWAVLLNAVRVLDWVYGKSSAAFAGATHFKYEPNATVGFYGLATLRSMFDGLMESVRLFEASRLGPFNIGAQVGQVYPLVTHDVLWGNERNFTFVLDYGSANNLAGQLNSGHQLTFSLSVLGAPGVPWNVLQAGLNALGPVTIGALGTSSPGWMYHNNVGLWQSIHAGASTYHCGSDIAGTWRVELWSDPVGLNAVKLRLRLVYLIAPGPYSYATSVFGFTLASRKANLSSPVLPHPALAYYP